MAKKIDRKPRPKRRPRPKTKRRPKPSLKKGSVTKFDYFPFRFIAYLNAKAYRYRLKESDDKYTLEIVGGPRTPENKITRKPKDGVVRSQRGFKPEYSLKVKSREKNPELFDRLKHMREKFLRKNRKISVRCRNFKGHNEQYRSLETCLTRCRCRCPEMQVENLMGPEDNKADFFQDMLEYQRLANEIYGTMRKIDIFGDGDEGPSEEES